MWIIPRKFCLHPKGDSPLASYAIGVIHEGELAGTQCLGFRNELIEHTMEMMHTLFPCR